MTIKTWVGSNGAAWATTTNWSPSGVPAATDDVQFTSSNGASIAAAAVCKSLTVTGSNVTISGTSTLGIYGDLTLNSTTVISASGAWSILSSAAVYVYNITTAGVTLNCSLTLNAGASSTYNLVKAASSSDGSLTLSALRTLTLTTGNLNLNGYMLSIGLFSSNVSTTRSITFSSDHSNYVILSGVGTVFNIATSTGWSYTGYSDFTLTDASASAKTVTTSGMSTYPANFYFCGGGVVTLTSGNYFLNVDCSIKTSTFSKTASSTLFFGGSLILGSYMGSSGIAGSGISTFSIVSGLGGSVTTGQVDLVGYDWGFMTFSSGNWQIYGSAGTSAAANEVICSGGNLTVSYDCYFYKFTVSGGNVTLDALVTLTYTSTSAAAFTISSGVLVMTTSGQLYCNVMVISGGIIRIDCYDNIDCLRINFSGNAFWDGVLSDPTYIDYTDYGYANVHIKHRSVASNWVSTTFPQYRYQSTSTVIIVKYTTYNTAASTLRNISDNSGFFAFCWDGYSTAVQRFGILTGSVIGGVSLYGISPSTFEGGTNFTINNGFMDSGALYRTQGGVITFTGNLNAPDNYIWLYNSEGFPFSLIFGSNGYYKFPSYTSIYSQRPDSYFYLNGCTLDLAPPGSYYYNISISFGIINLNYGGTNKIISNSVNAAFYSTGTNGMVLNARGVTLQGAVSFVLNATTVTNAGRSVNLPTFTDYFYSTATTSAALFYADYSGVSDVVTISDNSFLYSLTAYAGDNLNFTNLFLQDQFVPNQATVNGNSLTLLGIRTLQNFYNYGTSVFNNAGSINNVYVGNSIVTNTNVYLSISSYGISNLTLNSGNLILTPSQINQLLPNITINSINTASSSTFSINRNSYSPYYYIQNLTVNNTKGTISIDPGTELISEPNYIGQNRTWELGGITVPKISINNVSSIKITDVNNSNTTYIKEISSIKTAEGVAFVFSYGSVSIAKTGGTVVDIFGTNSLAFTLYGGGGAVNGQSIQQTYYVNSLYGGYYTWTSQTSSEANYDFGQFTFDGSLIDRRSGSVSTSSAASTYLSPGSHTIVATYTKDTATTGGSDSYSVTITFTGGSIAPSNLSFQAGRNFTFDKFFINPTQFPLTISSDESGAKTNLKVPMNNLGTLVQAANPGGGTSTVTIVDCAVTSTNYIWFAGTNTVNNGNNSGWIFGKNPTSQTSVTFFL